LMIYKKGFSLKLRKNKQGTFLLQRVAKVGNNI